MSEFFYLGVLLALQYCLANSESFFIKAYQHQKDEISVFLKDLIHLCFDIVDYMLRVMKGENENDYCKTGFYVNVFINLIF